MIFIFVIEDMSVLIITKFTLFRCSWTFLFMCASQEIQRGCTSSHVPEKSKVHPNFTFEVEFDLLTLELDQAREKNLYLKFGRYRHFY